MKAKGKTTIEKTTKGDMPGKPMPKKAPMAAPMKSGMGKMKKGQGF